LKEPRWLCCFVSRAEPGNHFPPIYHSISFCIPFGVDCPLRLAKVVKVESHPLKQPSPFILVFVISRPSNSLDCLVFQLFTVVLQLFGVEAHLKTRGKGVLPLTRDWGIINVSVLGYKVEGRKTCIQSSEYTSI